MRVGKSTFIKKFMEKAVLPYVHDEYEKARMTDAGINYFVNSYDARRDRAVLSLRLDYRYKQFNLYSEFSKYIETDDAYAINAGLGYKF